MKWRTIASSLSTDPAVVQGCIVALADQGLVSRGRGGGVSLAGEVEQFPGRGQAEPAAPGDELDTFARRLLPMLPSAGDRGRNWGSLQHLGYSRSDFDRLVALLVEDGRVSRTARGWGRAMGPDDSGQREPAGAENRNGHTAIAPRDLSGNARRLLSLVPDDGSRISATRLRTDAEGSGAEYRRALDELKLAGKIESTPGRGGGFSRTLAALETGPDTATRSLPTPGLVAREAELYAPFHEWLKGNWEGIDGLEFCELRPTATPAGWPRNMGKWSRPDVTGVQVSTFDWLPEKVVEVSTYEIKRWADASKRESVFEAAAHGRWAHRASLVVEVDPGQRSLPDLLQEEAGRFNLGLYTMRRRSGSDGWDISEVVAPEPQTPAHEQVNEFLKLYFRPDQRRANNFLRAIGKMVI